MVGEDRAPFVVLAAGESSRVGEPKGLVEVDGERWVERQIAAIAGAGASSVVLVLGRAVDAYRSALPWLDGALSRETIVRAARVRAVVNPRPELGPFSSLGCGLARVRGAAFVLPVDVPCAGGAVLDALEAALDAGAVAAIPTHAGRGGHPVLLSATLVGELAAVAPDVEDARLDRQLRARGQGVTRVPVDDDRVVLNLNTRADFAGLRPPRA